MDNFWINDYSILFRKDKLTEFFPAEYMTKEQKLNALSRFSIYLGVLLYVYNNNTNNFLIPICVFGITYFIYKNNNIELFTQPGSNMQQYTTSTINNPMKNKLVHELSTNKPPSLPSILDKNEVSENLNKSVYRDVGDIYNNSHSQRQFYTMPENNQSNFAHWLYDEPSCKSGNKEKCVQNIYTRYNMR